MGGVGFNLEDTWGGRRGRGVVGGGELERGVGRWEGVGGGVARGGVGRWEGIGGGVVRGGVGRLEGVGGGVGGAVGGFGLTIGL